jgi:predicted DsbA family dithiol-disulfide isomerase
MSVHIDVISDVVCPWCYIGKRRLEQALQSLRAAQAAPAVEVAWRPFQLNPDLPDAGLDRAEYLRRKFAGQAGQIYARVSAAGESVGIPFAFDRITRQPNSAAAHQLIACAAAQGRQDAMVEALFRGYFLEGADLTRRERLLQLAEAAGVDADAASAWLDDERRRQEVLDADREARELGVQGVPFFVFNRRLAVSGAQDAETLLRAIRRASDEPVGAP